MKQGFDIKVISPSGDVYRRKGYDKAPGSGKYVQQRIPFKFKFNETLRPNFGQVTLFNLNEQMRRGFKKDKKVTVKVWWQPSGSNSQLVLNADIINTQTFVRQDGTTYETDVHFRDTPKKYHRLTVSDYWSRGTKVCKVLRDLVTKAAGENGIAHFKCNSNKKYRRGKSFYLPVQRAIRQVASDAEVKFFFFNKKAYVTPVDEKIPSSASVDEKNIIKGSFSKMGIRDEILIPMEAKAKPGHQFTVNARDSGGKYLLYSGHHTTYDGRKLHSTLRLKK